MGFPTSLPGSLRAISKAALPSLAAGILASCISDGPNHTGGEYLGEHGVILQNSMYHVQVKGFPVAGFWNTDAEPSHLNDTILLAGIKGGFRAEPRFSFWLQDTSLISALSDPDSSLRLSVSTPTWQGVGGWNDLGTSALKSLSDSTAYAVDSLRFRVLAWTLKDTGYASKDWQTAAKSWSNRFRAEGDTLSDLPKRDVEDTIWLKVKNAYKQTSQLQARELPHLKELLADGHGHKHLIHIRLVPDSAGLPDSASAMLRLGGQWAYTGSKQPSLLFGSPILRADTIPSKFRLGPQSLGGGAIDVAYTLHYRDTSGAMVVPLARGIHLTLDRDRLFDSLEAGLLRQSVVPPPRGTGSLSLAYYVPFAAISLPILPAKLEGDLPVQVRLITGIDSLLAEGPGALTREDSIGLGSSIAPWYTTREGQPDVIVNKVSLAYAAAGDSLRKVILAFSQDSAQNDTVFLAIGGKAQLSASLGGYGSSNRLIIQVEARENWVIARSYLSLRSGAEDNRFRDPATGKTVDDLDSLLPRFVNPDDKSIRLRATAGIQTLLNRAGLGGNARQDFEFRPHFRAYTDSAVNSAGTKMAREVAFPVLSTLQPRIESGALSVDLDVYLYPLKAR